MLDAELKDLLSGGDCVAFVRGFAARRPLLRDRSAAARALHVLGASDPSLILQADAANPDMAKPLPVRDFEDALATLRDGDGAAAGTFREECQRFPARTLRRGLSAIINLTRSQNLGQSRALSCSSTHTSVRRALHVRPLADVPAVALAVHDRVPRHDGVVPRKAALPPLFIAQPPVVVVDRQLVA